MTQEQTELAEEARLAIFELEKSLPQGSPMRRALYGLRVKLVEVVAHTPIAEEPVSQSDT